MTRKSILRTTLAIVGAIVVGALGSGVWQNILGPLLAFLRDWALSIATFGLEAYKDNLYRDVARGFRESAGIGMLELVTPLFVAALVVLPVMTFLLVRIVEKKLARVTQEG